MATDRPAESQLIQRAVRGDDRALEDLLARHSRALSDYVGAHIPADLRGVVDAHDVTQDVYCEVCRRVGTFADRGDNAFYRWLVTIARNRLIALVRHHRTLKRGGGRAAPTGAGGGSAEAIRSDQDVACLLDQVAAHRRSPSQSAAAHELAAAVERSMERLPPHYREAVRLRHLEGLGPGEAAARMNRTEGAFQMLVGRALKLLRTELVAVAGESAPSFTA